MKTQPAHRFLLIRFVLCVFVVLIICPLFYSCRAKPKTEIVIWDFPRWKIDADSTSFQWMQDECDRFEAQHPDVKFKLSPLTWADGEEKLLFSFKQRKYPDIFPMNIEQYNYIRNRIELEDLSSIYSEEEWDDFKPRALKAFSNEGKIDGLPFYLSGQVMIVNTTLAERYNVPLPSGIYWTKEEFYDFVKKSTLDLNQDGKIDIHGLSMIIAPGKRSAWPFFLYDNPELMDSLKVDTPQFKTNLEFLYDLVHKDKITPLQTLTSAEYSVVKDFLDGKYMCHSGGMWVLSLIHRRQRNKEINSQFKLMSYPAPSSEKAQTFFSVAGYGVAKQKDKDKARYCKLFMRQLCEKGYDYNLYSVLPARKSHDDVLKKYEYLSAADQIIASAHVFYPIPFWKEIDDIIQRNLQDIFFQKKTIKEGLALAQKNVNFQLERMKKGESKGND